MSDRRPAPSPASLVFVALLLGLPGQAGDAAAAASPAPPVLRAAIQPPAGQLTTEAIRQLKLVAIHGVATLLQERLRQRAGFVLVDAGRFAAIRDELTSPALVNPGRLTLPAFSARLPVDLLVQLEPVEEGIAVDVAGGGDGERRVVPYGDARDFQALLAATATLVAGRLGLDADEAARLGRLDPDAGGEVAAEAIVAAVVSGAMRVEWGDVGLARIESLAPHLDAARSSPTVARAVLEAGLQLGKGNMRQPLDSALRRRRRCSRSRPGRKTRGCGGRPPRARPAWRPSGFAAGWPPRSPIRIASCGSMPPPRQPPAASRPMPRCSSGPCGRRPTRRRGDSWPPRLRG